MASDDSSDNHGRRSGFSLDTLLDLSGRAGQTFTRAVGQSGNILDRLLKAPEYMEQIGRAGSYLKDMRQVAGLTLDDLARAVDIDNPDVLRAVEEGRSPVTLDILYRLASFYSRNDPVTFMVNFSREYAPWLWQVLRVTGVEKFLITLERELKFINIYRSRESARHLGDEDFDKMLGFVRSGFNMAMDFIEPLEASKTEPGERAPKDAPAGAASDKSKTGSSTTKPRTRTRARATASKTTAATSRKAPANKAAKKTTGSPRKGTKKEG